MDDEQRITQQTWMTEEFIIPGWLDDMGSEGIGWANAARAAQMRQQCWEGGWWLDDWVGHEVWGSRKKVGGTGEVKGLHFEIKAVGIVLWSYCTF